MTGSATASSFPSSMLKSRVIAFGARALDPDAEPKYLNSPETKLFDKGVDGVQLRARAQIRLRQGRADRGRGLYGRDRAAIRPASPMWSQRSAPPSPSGRWNCSGSSRPSRSSASTATRPARRRRRAPSTACCPPCAKAIPSASPSCRKALTPTISCAAPDRRAFAECVQAARPLIDVVWLRERSAQAIDTPERRAAFEARLEHLLAEIGNTRVRDHYRREVKNRLFALLARDSPRAGAPQPCRPARQARRAKRGRRRCPRHTVSPPPSRSRSSITPGCSITSPRRWRGSRSGTGRLPLCSGCHQRHLRGSRHRPRAPDRAIAAEQPCQAVR